MPTPDSSHYGQGSTPVISVKASPKGSASPALTLPTGTLLGFSQAGCGRPQAFLRSHSKIANLLTSLLISGFNTPASSTS
jgi:hypothetical protein